MLLKDMLIGDVACCAVNTTASEAAQLMRARHVGDLVVVAGSDEQVTPVGVVTDRDLVVEVLAKGINAAITPVQSFIRTPVVIANEQEDSSVVIERMRQHGVRRIPVVNEHSVVVGIVTSNDLLRALNSEMTTLLEALQKGQRNEQRQRR